MQEDLHKELEAFGLTPNQAKIYLAILQYGSISVGKITESTKLHRQDIYKTLPKLENMGLIARALGKPINIEAIPVEKALNALVDTERDKANERATRLRGIVKELIKAVKEQPAKPETSEEAKFILLSTDADIKNMADYTFEHARIEFDMVLNEEIIARRMYRFRDHFRTLAKNKVRTRLIIETPKNGDLVKGIIEEVRPNMGDFTVKVIRKERPIPYYVIDHKESWISRNKKTDTGMPFVLWTNSTNITQFRQANFEEDWNNPKAITIYPQETPTKKKPMKRQKASTTEVLLH